MWLLHLKERKEKVQLFYQQGGPFSGPKVEPVVGEELASLPHLPAVVAIQVVFNPPPVV